MIRTLTRREKMLAGIVGAAAALFFTLFILDYFLKHRSRLRADYTARTAQLKRMQNLAAEKPVWEQREAWLRAKQPVLENEDKATGDLLEQIRTIARTHSVLLDNPVPRAPVKRPEYTSVFVDIETKSSWRALVKFLGELQGPEKFIVLETANLEIDAADQTQLHGRLRIARWFAPK